MSKSREMMKAVFGLDNGFMRAAERLFDLLLLNILFVLTCLPIVTLGIGKLALYATAAELRERGRLPLLSSYWKHVRQNWKQGLLLGLVEILVTSMALVDLWLIQGFEGFPVTLMTIVAYAVLFLSVMLHLYVYPVAAQYELGIKDLYIKSFLLAGINGQWSLLLLVVLGLLGLLMTSSAYGLVFGCAFLLIIGCSSLVYGHMLIMTKIFERSVR